jgi:hypothetical protein
MFISDFGSGFFSIPDPEPGSRREKALDPGSGTATLVETKEMKKRPPVLTGQAFVAGGGRGRGGGAVVGRLVRALYVYLLQDKPAKLFGCF